MSEKEKEVLTDEEAEAVEDQQDTEETACEEADKDTVKEEEDSQETEQPETEEASQEEAAEAEEETQEGGILKNFKKKDKKLEALENQKKELEDKVMRQMAEFENYRKRTEKEKATMFEMGAKSVIEKMLPVVDNFERGLASVSEEDQTDPIYEGMNLIYKQLIGELDKLGVKPIEALGQEFNPDLHNAVMQVESEEFEEGIVAQELQKGYMYRDSVVRHSMVAVAQ
ncbi:MAG: nucleotide exchange factor GrpE [Lachnospiraceae bacterium]|nr:nucleotide exchange factor GrpE [Lachnospiraceae bacterium]